MQHNEPPLPARCSEHSLFRIGKDSHGHWVVQDDSGRCGGLFVNRVQALKFAMFENGNDSQAVIMVPGIFELNMILPLHNLPSNDNTLRQRQIV